MQENDALSQVDITSMMTIFGLKFPEAVRVQQHAREHIRTAMTASHPIEQNGLDAAMGDDVRSRIRFIIAAAPASCSGQVSGTVHASYDGKRPLSLNKDLKHARVVAATVGFKLCAHSSAKRSRLLESSQSVSVEAFDGSPTSKRA